MRIEGRRALLARILCLGAAGLAGCGESAVPPPDERRKGLTTGEPPPGLKPQEKPFDPRKLLREKAEKNAQK